MDRLQRFEDAKAEYEEALQEIEDTTLDFFISSILALAAQLKRYRSLGGTQGDERRDRLCEALNVLSKTVRWADCARRDLVYHAVMNRGMPYSEVAKAADIEKSTAHRWVKNYKPDYMAEVEVPVP